MPPSGARYFIIDFSNKIPSLRDSKATPNKRHLIKKYKQKYRTTPGPSLSGEELCGAYHLGANFKLRRSVILLAENIIVF